MIRSFTWIIYYWKLRLCLVYFFSSFNFRYLSLKISYPFGTITHLSSLNIFHTICGSHTCHTVQEIFFFHLVSPNPVKNKNWTANPGEERKKKKKKSKVVKRCDWYCLWVLYLCLITILSLSYELWKLKIHFKYFQFPKLSFQWYFGN